MEDHLTEFQIPTVSSITGTLRSKGKTNKERKFHLQVQANGLTVPVLKHIFLMTARGKSVDYGQCLVFIIGVVSKKDQQNHILSLSEKTIQMAMKCIHMVSAAPRPWPVL